MFSTLIVPCSLKQLHPTGNTPSGTHRLHCRSTKNEITSSAEILCTRELFGDTSNARSFGMSWHRFRMESLSVIVYGQWNGIWMFLVSYGFMLYSHCFWFLFPSFSMFFLRNCWHFLAQRSPRLHLIRRKGGTVHHADGVHGQGTAGAVRQVPDGKVRWRSWMTELIYGYLWQVIIILYGNGKKHEKNLTPIETWTSMKGESAHVKTFGQHYLFILIQIAGASLVNCVIYAVPMEVVDLDGGDHISMIFYVAQTLRHYNPSGFIAHPGPNMSNPSQEPRHTSNCKTASLSSSGDNKMASHWALCIRASAAKVVAWEFCQNGFEQLTAE